MRSGFKKIRYDPEIREAICIWFFVSLVGSLVSCFSLYFIKNALERSLAIAWNDVYTTVNTLPYTPLIGVGLGTLIAMALWFIYLQWSKNTTSFLQKCLGSLSAGFSCVSILTGLSIFLIALILSYLTYWTAKAFPPSSLACIGLGTSLAMILWFIAIDFSNKKLLQRYLSCLTEPFNFRSLIGGLIICTIAVFVSGCAFWFASNTDGRSWGAVMYIVENPGGVFAILTGCATIVGTYIAVQSILELKHTITSFPQLIDRVIFMITENKESEEPVSILAYSPLSGAWNIDAKQQSKLRAAMWNDRSKVELVCLGDADHLALLYKVAKSGTLERGSISAKELRQFQADCKGLIERLARKGIKEDGEKDPEPDGNAFATVTKTLDKAKMPGFYFYVSEARAIVVSPVGFPLNGHVDVAPTGARPVVVETLGFETTDRHIIKILRTEFKKFKDIGADYNITPWTVPALATVKAELGRS